MRKTSFYWRITSLVAFFFILFVAIIARLFYWQVLASEKLMEMAKNQYHSEIEIRASRGEIFAVDNFPLATTQKAYLLYASLAQLKQSKEKIASSLAPFLISLEDDKATSEGKKKSIEEIAREKEVSLLSKLNFENLAWVILEHKITEDVKNKIDDLKLAGLGFEEEPVRFYPEASMSAHLLGFVGKNEVGRDVGYFGLEGFYDVELRGRGGLITQEMDPSDKPILIGSFSNQEKKDGQNLLLHLDRSIQFLVEEKLQKAVEKYRAKSGTVVIINPQTGGIISLASYPSFAPEEYFKSDKLLFKNPVISDLYEPGSTFKIMVMAAAIDKQAVKSNTKCDICTGPLKIDKYEIKTWNEKYYPESTMTEVMKHSDNIGMVFAARKLGLDDLWQYLKDFGFGEKTRIDLQGEVSCLLRPKKEWNEVDLATSAFGQGISVTAIQMARAGAVIANRGKLMEPRVVKEIISGQEKIEIKPKVTKQVIKPETAEIITKMMIEAVDGGDVKYLKIPGYKIAGKTGTAQIPVAGHYDKEKTIASFIGFAPADKPRFVMLVNLREPETSPWGSETAAPLFFSITKDLLTYYGIQPD